MSAPTLTPAEAKRLFSHYRTMLRIRRFEERVLSLFTEAQLRGTAHVCLGQEAVAAGACGPLEPEDLVTSNHRGHGHMLARGASMPCMMAELYGGRAGCARGVGGSQHMTAPEVGFLGCNGITGGGLPLAAGAGLSLGLRGARAVVLAFFGDGAMAQGTFHESANLAAVWRLPVVFLCENNQYAMGTQVAATSPVTPLSTRAGAYGMPGQTVDGTDPLAVEDAVAAARERALDGEGPSLVEAVCFRLGGHSRSDPCDYVPPEHAEQARRRDPVPAARTRLIEAGTDEAELVRLESEARQEVEDAVASVRDPQSLSLGEYERTLYPSPKPTSASSPGAPAQPGETTYVRALGQALAHALETDPRVVLLGEDIAEYGGAFRVTDGLAQRFGAARVRNTPISENTVVGCAAGAAMTGLRPVVEIMFMDFLLLALDQLANHAAKWSTISAGKLTAPLVLRVPAGGRRGYGPTHSQCFEGLLLNVPGLKLFTPATVQDAYGLLLTAIADESPVVFIEHKLLYGVREELDPAAEVPPPGRARVVRQGRDLTMVAFSHTVRLCLTAAEHLAREGVEAEVVDLRTLRPLDLDTVTESAARTQRLLVAEEGPRTGGVGGEIAAAIQEAAFGYLDAPILRVAARDLPVPACEELETAVLPQVADLVAAARTLVHG